MAELSGSEMFSNVTGNSAAEAQRHTTTPRLKHEEPVKAQTAASLLPTEISFRRLTGGFLSTRDNLITSREVSV